MYYLIIPHEATFYRTQCSLLLFILTKYRSRRLMLQHNGRRGAQKENNIGKNHPL